MQNVFAASPVKETSPQINTINLTYTTALSYSNSGTTISSVWIDFLDGQGYKSLTANGTVSKTYTDSSGYKRFAIKVQYSNSTYNYCYSGQFVTVNSLGARYTPLTQFDIDNPTKIIAAVTGQHYAGKVYVRYSTKRNGTALQGKMVKPFIIVEGYDIHDIAPKLQETNYDANKLIDEWNKLQGYDFNAQLDETAGYDLVFVDYYTMDYIQNNSKMLQKVIEWVNGEKAIAGSIEQNVVMGISLGGLLARYTLAKMTKDLGTTSTQTRLLLTHDSPHQGGNVPLGFQHFLYDFGEAKIVVPLKDVSNELSQFYVLSDQPATQQLLIARVTDANGGVEYNSFLSGLYRTMITFNASDPPPSYQFKATAQGSQCSRYVMQPGTLLSYKDGNVATANFYWFAFRSKYKLTVQINALPEQGTSTQISYVKMQRNIRLFFGVIGTGWKTTYEKTRYSPSNIIPWDAVPGGTQSASGRSGGSFSNFSTVPDPTFSKHNTFFGNLWRFAVYPWFNVNSYLEVPFQQDVFTNVPLNSALDIQNATIATFNQSYIFPVNGLSGSTSAKYIAQEEFAGTVNNVSATLYNLTHTDFTKRNSQWIFSEMENITYNDCTAACSNFLTITGTEPVCSTATFSVSLPPGATVIWSIDPQSVATVNSSTGIVTKQGNGTATLTATITSCGIVTPVSRTIRVGGPAVNIAYSRSGSCNGTYQTWFLNATSPDAVTSWLWTVDNPSSGSWNIYSPNSSNTYVAVSGGGGISLTATNACGSTRNGVTIYSNCNFRAITATPNPATDNVNVALVTDKKSPSKKTEMIYQIKISDQIGNVKKEYKYVSGISNPVISLSGLMSGIYIIQAFDGTLWGSTKVIKQ